jgi:hypothetical protein
MLRNLWSKLTGSGDSALKHEAEMEDMSDDERHWAGQSVEDIAADNYANDRYGGAGSPSMRNHQEPPPFS